MTRLGTSDCERIGEGLLAQPVNAISSLGFIAAGSLIVYRGLRRRQARIVMFGAATAAVGVGSVLFHGPQPAGAEAVHDLSIAGVVVLAGVMELARSRSELDRDARDYGLAFAALALGVAAFALGRTGSPACDPDSVLQAHALWHLLATAALSLYAGAEHPAR